MTLTDVTKRIKATLNLFENESHSTDNVAPHRADEPPSHQEPLMYRALSPQDELSSNDDDVSTLRIVPPQDDILPMTERLPSLITNDREKLRPQPLTMMRW